MSYLEFLARWYNWPYLGALGLAATTLLWRSGLAPLGRRLAARMGLEDVSGPFILISFFLALAIIGLTVNGALHDYWPQAQEAGFLPGLVLSLGLALLVTRFLGRIREEHFPEIKAVSLGTPDLAGLEGRVVSRSVGPDYAAGRAQVMEADGTLHIVLCKTAGEEISYGSRVTLEEYDEADGRYYVARTGEGNGSAAVGAPEAGSPQ